MHHRRSYKEIAWDRVRALGARSACWKYGGNSCSGGTSDGMGWTVSEDAVTLEIFDNSVVVDVAYLLGDDSVVADLPYLKVTVAESGVTFEFLRGENSVQTQHYAKLVEILRLLQVSVDCLYVPLSSGTKMLVLLADA